MSNFKGYIVVSSEDFNRFESIDDNARDEFVNDNSKLATQEKPPWITGDLQVPSITWKHYILVLRPSV